MNKLVKVTKTKIWSEWCKNILGKYCIFKTTDGKVIGGFVEEYTQDSCDPIKVRDFNTMTVAKIRPIDIAPSIDCEIYDLKYGVLKNEPKIKDAIVQCYLIDEKETYIFEYIDTKHVYSFIDKKSGCIVFLTFSDVTKDKATVRMVGGFYEKEFTAKEFAETFDDYNGGTYCGCPYSPSSCVDDTFDFFTAMNYLKSGRKVRKVDWPDGDYVSIGKRNGSDVIENQDGIKIASLEFSPFESNWELYSEE